MRHLRKLRRLYRERRENLASWLDMGLAERNLLRSPGGGLSILVPLPDGVSDTQIVREVGEFGLSPSPLSRWYSGPDRPKSGLLLGVTNVTPQALEGNGGALLRLLERHGTS